MRFLLDTNILIPLEDSQIPLQESLANFVRLSNQHGHQLVYHPASVDDIQRDINVDRRTKTLQRLKQYVCLDERPVCPWNTAGIAQNDVADNEILYALYCDAVHALVTEDRGIHDKARAGGLLGRVYTIQTAEDWLRRLYEPRTVVLPNIEEVELYSLTPELPIPFFDSLRASYAGFDDWFRAKARDGRRAWVSRQPDGQLGAVCVFAHQHREQITEEGRKLHGAGLKLCTFKVDAPVRGRKIGELFLKAAFRHATAHRLEEIFIHGDDQDHFLFGLLQDFGFSHIGLHPGSGGRDAVYLKEHPINPPTNLLNSFAYLRQYFPHFRRDEAVKKFIVPIKPEYHDVLFPDYPFAKDIQLGLFKSQSQVGNAIKLAYLCHAQTKVMSPGDLALFYRSGDQSAVTSLGVVESYETLMDASVVAGRVKRRTVYSMEEIAEMVKRPTRVMLFRLVRHFQQPLDLTWLKSHGVTKGAPQSIVHISTAAFEKVFSNGQ